MLLAGKVRKTGGTDEESLTIKRQRTTKAKIKGNVFGVGYELYCYVSVYWPLLEFPLPVYDMTATWTLLLKIEKAIRV